MLYIIWEVKFWKTKYANTEKNSELRQEELANDLGVTRQTIISLENGKYCASLLLAHKAAKRFGTTIEELFIFEE